MNTVKKVELLAPAGSMESLYAAVQAGADAIYLGGSKFSARAYASNFDEENMKLAVNYCHAYGVKIYITVNTLIKENEINDVLEYVGFLYKIGVDALIVQDVGIIYLIRRYFPDFELHASTQMTVHNGEGAKYLTNLGLRRIVLSRELSLDEIKYISKDLNIETEIFIHGALCVCYSGQCLMSSMIGGRSGNRGRCAQPCRLPYTLINKHNGESKKGYLLSPKDICTLECLEDIIKSGTSSLKIEGRMKRPEYVAGVISIYRKAIDTIYEKGHLNMSHIKKDINILSQLFNREGFSKAYMFGNTGRDMMAYNFPKNTGVKLGKVSKDLLISLDQDININDGIRCNENGFSVSKIIKDNKEVNRAFKGEKVKIKPLKYKRGDVLYKTSDSDLLDKLSKYYKNPYMRRINLNLKVKFKIEKPMEISVVYNGVEIKVLGEYVQKALKKPISKEKLIENLKKTKDTPFEFNIIEFSSFEEGFMPVSCINALRRELIKKINTHICNESKRELNINNMLNKIYNRDKEDIVNDKYVPNTLVCVNSIEQFKAAKKLEFEDIAVTIFVKNSSISLENIDEKVFLKVPNVIKEEFESVCKTIEENLHKIKGIVTGNLGVINRFKEKISIIADYKMNIFNSFGMEFYKENVDLCSLSVELNRKEIKQILNKTKLPCQVVLYGKTELMISEYCVVGSISGRKSLKNKCSGACLKGKFVLKDRMGTEFPIITDKFCRSHIYNNVSTNLIAYIKELIDLNIKSFRLDFIDEDYEETLKILKAYNEKSWKYGFSEYTRGHFKRGVE